MTTTSPPKTASISVEIPRATALALCNLAGLAPDNRGRYGGKYWELDEAAREAAKIIAGYSHLG